MKKLLISTVLLFFIACSSSDISLLPEKVSPDVYKVLLENEDIKILEVTFAPGQSDNMHEHYLPQYTLLKGVRQKLLFQMGLLMR